MQYQRIPPSLLSSYSLSKKTSRSWAVTTIHLQINPITIHAQQQLLRLPSLSSAYWRNNKSFGRFRNHKFSLPVLKLDHLASRSIPPAFLQFGRSEHAPRYTSRFVWGPDSVPVDCGQTVRSWTSPEPPWLEFYSLAGTCSFWSY